MATSARWAGAGAIVTVVAGLLLWSPEPDYSRIEVATASDLGRELDALRQRLNIPGMSAAIAEGNQIIWARGFGYADVARQVRVDPDTTSFHLASVTKPYTATVALQLADEGRLDLDAPISRFGLGMPTEPSARVWHVLSHTAGPTPGSVYRYDARAFGTLTTVVERASGQPFAAALTDRIVRKLGLTHTAPNPQEFDRAACRAQLAARVLGVCGTEAQAERARQTFSASGLDRRSVEADLAVGYARQWGRQLWPAGLIGPMRPERHLTDLFASAGLVASAGDLLRFSIALDQGALLSQSSLVRMYTPSIGQAGEGPTFGMGWFLQRHQGLSLAWHFGQAFESSSLLLKIPDRRVAFVTLANSDGLSRRRWLGDHGDVLKSPAAVLFLKWYLGGHQL
jgi:CubicO group peptidase (beta-lactamase class C family)